MLDCQKAFVFAPFFTIIFLMMFYTLLKCRPSMICPRHWSWSLTQLIYYMRGVSLSSLYLLDSYSPLFCPVPTDNNKSCHAALEKGEQNLFLYSFCMPSFYPFRWRWLFASYSFLWCMHGLQATEFTIILWWFMLIHLCIRGFVAVSDANKKEHGHKIVSNSQLCHLIGVTVDLRNGL